MPDIGGGTARSSRPASPARFGSRPASPTPLARSMVSVSPPKPGTASIQTHLLSSQASFRKELADYRARIAVLEREYQQASGRCADALSEVKRLRALVEATERELIAARKNIERLMLERHELAEQSREDKDLVRRLETKLVAGAKGLGLLQKNVTLTQKLEKLQDAKRGQESLILAQEEEISKMRNEIKVLTRALDIHADELGIDSDIKSVLLYDLAHARQEKEEREAEGAEMRKLIEALRRENEALRTRAGELQATCERQRDDISDLERKLADAQSELLAATKTSADMAVERQVILEYVQEEAEKYARLQAESTAARDESARTEAQLRSEHAAMSERCERAEAEAEAARRREAEKSENLSRVVEMKQKELTARAARVAELERALEAERQRAERAEREREGALGEAEDARRAGEESEGEIAAALEVERAEKRALQGELEKLQGSLAKYQHEIGRSIEELTRENEALRGEAGRAGREAAGRERALQEKVESLMGELSAAVDEREHLKFHISESVNKTAAAVASQQNMEREVEHLREQLEGVTRGKSLLQKTMLEQLGAARAQCEKAEAERDEARRQLAAQAAEVERLRGEFEAERQRRGVDMPSALRTPATPQTPAPSLPAARPRAPAPRRPRPPPRPLHLLSRTRPAVRHRRGPLRRFLRRLQPAEPRLGRQPSLAPPAAAAPAGPAEAPTFGSAPASRRGRWSP
eukprot:tig00020912_g15858.t1